MDEYRKSVTVHGREITVSTGLLAQQAGGAVLVQSGGTAVLVTATMSKQPREGIDFFPLLVDYEERQYAAGRFPGSYMRREGRASERAILAARLIDRPLRPLFPDGFRNDVQIVAMVMSLDEDVPPETLAILGASLAVQIARIPFSGPVAAARVGLSGDDFIINPTYRECSTGELDLVVAGTDRGVIMVEAGANRLAEEDILEGIEYGMETVTLLLAFQKEVLNDLGITPVTFQPPAPNQPVIDFIQAKAGEQVVAILAQFLPKAERDEQLAAVETSVKEALAALPAEDPVAVALAQQPVKMGDLFKSLTKKSMRKQIIEQSKRVDGRTLSEIRPISCQAGILNRVHGSGLFTRGTTQVLSITTLGTSGDAQMLDDLNPDHEKRYLHHYNFPGYSVGEVKPFRGASRREIGHGLLAERSLLPVLPDKESFPYTIRVVSEVLSSNGSTSMGSVCGSTLSLMDAGVPIAEPISGVAMGLIKEGEEVRVLTDIQGIEDFLGDMDFKVAGGAHGITALQMDIKIEGITQQIIETALTEAKAGRLFILEKMLAVLDSPREAISPFAPRLLTTKVPVDMIGTVIGPGGKMIKRITEETGAKVDIEDDGTVTIAAPQAEKANAALRMIEDLTRTIEVGGVYMGLVTRVISHLGAFVQILPGKEGMVHISQLADRHVRKVEEEVNVGDEIVVKVKQVDGKGRINLTRLGIHPNDALATRR
ncbi:polyribonucleotide nucleotidyltransferase [Anthocerotibacter panamensis]|uniref:polyribonucleotide nucleotidyltransferase n=1 Tax=Anthocerotibacter panamensis TaxID=2857077 RepID=UPI001C406F17|nr:polyribonucleotide nucleotidyltransferase [Anthocerotibacter panamensis]